MQDNGAILGVRRISVPQEDHAGYLKRLVVQYGMTPAQYWQTDHWKALKSAVGQRDGWNCRLCDAKQGEGAKHIHHMTYVRAPFNEAPADMITVCTPCHEERCHGVHTLIDQPIMEDKTMLTRNRNNNDTFAGPDWKRMTPKEYKDYLFSRTAVSKRQVQKAVSKQTAAVALGIASLKRYSVFGISDVNRWRAEHGWQPLQLASLASVVSALRLHDFSIKSVNGTAEYQVVQIPEASRIELIGKLAHLKGARIEPRLVEASQNGAKPKRPPSGGGGEAPVAVLDVPAPSRISWQSATVLIALIVCLTIIVALVVLYA